MKVTVVGTGYVGAVSAACLAWLGHDVVGYDKDERRVDELSGGQLPFHEPGLAELLRSASQDHGLRFSADPRVTGARDVIFLCVGTPMDSEGLPDLSQLEEAVAAIAQHLSPGTVVVNKSTVPVGCGNWVRTLIEEAQGEGPTDFAVVSNPEFLREGCAVADFLHPDRIVLGGNNGAIDKVVKLYRPILRQDFDCGRADKRPGLFITDLGSAEMIKYAANAFLATKISFANEIARICELVGADARQVLPAIGADDRIGPTFLNPGIGWGGSCFGKDVAALIATGTEYGYGSPLLQATVAVNQGQRESILHKLQHELKVLKGRRITLLGLAFKPDTDDLRDAPALDLARRLVANGCVVRAYDPVVKELPNVVGAIRTATDPYDAALRADAVVVVTDWPEFKLIEPARLREAMTGTVVLDGRNMLDATYYAAAGLRVVGVGW